MKEERVVQVFVGSPSDVVEERKRAFEIIKHINDDQLLPEGWRFSGVGWDQTHYPKLAWLSPQEAIDKGIPRPADCDIAVFVFWKRVGTPLPPGSFKENGAGPAPTGSLWEFHDAMESLKRPWVLVYRSKRSPAMGDKDEDALEFASQVKGVQRFFSGFKDKEGCYRADYYEYSDADDFARHLEQDLKSFIKQQAAQSGAGATATNKVEKLYLSRLPSTGRFLFGRESELKALETAWGERRIKVLSLVAWGGVGKSTLVKRWLLNRVNVDGFRDADRVYAWSFFSQGTTEKTVTADLFIESALTWFGDPNPKDGSPWDKGERLARLVGAQRCLLLLDGLEPLQNPPGPQEGRIKDQAVCALVLGLASHNAGLCVITTRLGVKELEEFEGRTAQRLDLDNLDRHAGAQLLTELGVKGEQEELEQASEEFGGHALALTLLGSYVSDVCDGDVRRRSEIGPLQQDIRHGGHARRVMASYEKWFCAGPEIAVLRLLGLFDRPASGPEVQAVREPPLILHLTDTIQALGPQEWPQVVNKLRRARLIADPDPNQPDTLDTHPLVREHFGQQLREEYPDSWREGHARLYAHLMNTAVRRPASVEQMFPVFAAIIHGCEAGRHWDALQLYRDRVLRGEAYFSTYKLGAFGNEMAILYHFFEPPWKRPVAALTEPDQAFILRQVGYCQRGLGILSEAVKWTAQAAVAYDKLKDQKSCMEVYGQLSHLHLHLGNLEEALEVAKKSTKLSDDLVDSIQLTANLGRNYLRWVNRARVGDILHHSGRYTEAEVVFREAERILNIDRPNWLLYGHSGFKYCDLLLTIGQDTEARRRASWMIDWARANPSDPSATKLTTGLAHLCLANSTVAGYRLTGRIDVTEASKQFSKALDDIRLTGRQDSVVRALLDRARFFVIAGRLSQAQSDLEIASTIARRGDLRLFQVDYYLAAARLRLDCGQKDMAREFYSKAQERIHRMGYHRRDEEAFALLAEL